MVIKPSEYKTQNNPVQIWWYIPYMVIAMHAYTAIGGDASPGSVLSDP